MIPRGTLAGRLLIASTLLALVVVGAFAVLVVAISALRDANEREARAKEVTTATLRLEKLVIDLETGLRGLSITGNERFLRPWTDARAELPVRLARFDRIQLGDAAQRRRARRLLVLIRSYVADYSDPLVEIARLDPAVARTPIAAAEGKRRIDEIRRSFDEFLRAENVLAARSDAAADSQARRALASAVLAVAASTLLIVLFGAYLVRAVARPIRAAADGATRLAAGDLGFRLRERGPGEVGELACAFNEMAGRLERSREELQEQNRQLRQSERQKSELVSIVSHEVRTPLSSVIGFASYLLNHDVDEERRRHFLRIIETQGKRLGGLLDDFLDVQRMEEGNLRLDRGLLDMAALLREQVQLFSGASAEHELRLDVPDAPLPVDGDANRLAQVVGNLLSNAIKYSPGGGVVRVAGEVEDGTVRVAVRDEGLGIPPEHQDDVFTKFFRGNAAERGIPGTGLGLAFARAIVEAHGGELRFTSETGKGSTFWVELPRAPEEGVGAAAGKGSA